MNVYIVTWFNDDYDNIRAEQVEAYDAAAACYGSGATDVKQIISVMRIYKGND